MVSPPRFTTSWNRALLADPNAHPMTKVVGVATFGRYAAGRECYVSLAKAMQLTGCRSRGTVHRAIQQLISLGYVALLEAGAPPKKPGRYLLALPEGAGEVADTAPDGRAYRSDGETDNGPMVGPMQGSDGETDIGPMMERYWSDGETQVLSSSDWSTDGAPPQRAQAPGSGARQGGRAKADAASAATHRQGVPDGWPPRKPDESRQRYAFRVGGTEWGRQHDAELRAWAGDPVGADSAQLEKNDQEDEDAADDGMREVLALTARERAKAKQGRYRRVVGGDPWADLRGQA
jgi:hypothetical protein